MEPWKLVLDEAAFQFFNGLRAVERGKVLYALDQIKRDPRQECHFGMTDASGRPLSVLAVRPFLFIYWRDDFALEVRVVDIQRVRR
jgi:hypothetical protein